MEKDTRIMCKGGIFGRGEDAEKEVLGLIGNVF